MHACAWVPADMHGCKETIAMVSLWQEIGETGVYALCFGSMER